MDWEAIGIGVSAAVAVVGGNAFVMKMIIDNAVSKLHIIVSDEYVKKADCAHCQGK